MRHHSRRHTVQLPDAQDSAVLVSFPSLCQAPWLAQGSALLLQHTLPSNPSEMTHITHLKRLPFSLRTIACHQEDLSFFFTEELTNDDTPESVFLQKNDEIIVRKRRKPLPPTPVCPDSAYFKQMRSLLDDSEHKDVTFIVGPCKDEVRAHKSVLVARGEYFKGLFRKGGMRESESNEMVMEKHTVPTLERMLEFMYTNRVEQLKDCSAHEVLDLLSAAEEYLLPDLKKLCEHAAQSLISTEMVAKMMVSPTSPCSPESSTGLVLATYLSSSGGGRPFRRTFAS